MADGRLPRASEILSSDCLPSAGSFLTSPSPCGSPRFSINFQYLVDNYLLSVVIPDSARFFSPSFQNLTSVGVGNFGISSSDLVQVGSRLKPYFVPRRCTVSQVRPSDVVDSCCNASVSSMEVPQPFNYLTSTTGARRTPIRGTLSSAPIAYARIFAFSTFFLSIISLVMLRFHGTFQHASTSLVFNEFSGTGSPPYDLASGLYLPLSSYFLPRLACGFTGGNVLHCAHFVLLVLVGLALIGIVVSFLRRFPGSSPMVANRSTLSWMSFGWMRWHVFCGFQSQLVFTAPTGLAHFESLTNIYPLRYGFLHSAFPVTHLPSYFGRRRTCGQAPFGCLAILLCFLSLAFICLCPFICEFWSFRLVHVRNRIVLGDVLAPTALARMATLSHCSFLAILLIYLAFPIVLVMVACIIVWFTYFPFISVHISAPCAILAPRSISHTVQIWGIGSNPVPAVDFGVDWFLKMVAFALSMRTDMR